MFREILDKALGKDAAKADIAQMIVLIDYKPVFCDYANFTKYDPDWWLELADDVVTNSSNPNLAVGLYAIAASQYFFDGEYRNSNRCKEALTRGMSLREAHPVLMAIGKATMMSEMSDGEVSHPTRKEVAEGGLASALINLDMYEQLIEKHGE